MEEIGDGASDVGDTAGPIMDTGSGAITNLVAAVGGDTSSK